MAESVNDSPLLIRNDTNRTLSINDRENDLYNESGNMGASLPAVLNVTSDPRMVWEFNYQEAAIFLEEGENNDKYTTHPRTQDSVPAYLLAHSTWMYVFDLFATLLILLLALCEGEQSVSYLYLPVGVHGSLELFALLILGLELGIKMRWLGLQRFFRHKRTLVKFFTLLVMLSEAITVLIRQKNHVRVTRALRPLFVIDTHYCKGIRRISRQILQTMPAIMEMILLLLFFMLIFSILGEYHKSEFFFQYFITIQESFISLFVLLTTANYPDVMMEVYANSRGYAIFFIIYMSLELYFLMNLFLAVVYDTFSGLEKDKLKKLFFHKRTGCQYAFRLLVTKFHSDSMKLKHFVGMMGYFKPKKSRKEVYLMFKSMNRNKTGTLDQEEFYQLYEMCDIKWEIRCDDYIWSSSFKQPFKKIFKGLNWFVNWRWFDYFVYLVIAANFIWIFAETVMLSVNQVNVRGYNFPITWQSVVFVSIYFVEAVLKILGKGPKVYFKPGWDLFDFLVTFVSMVGLLGELFDNTFYYITVLRPFRLLRLFKIKRSYRDVLGTFFMLFSRLASLAGVIILLYYFFAVIGMEAFRGYDLTNCCKNTSVEDFYRKDNNSVIQGYYYLNDFDNILISGVTLFELTVVNNWFIIMDGFAYHISEWTRIYFMIFYLVMMIVMTIVVAFILELFLFRIQYRRKMHLEDIDDHERHRVEVTLSEEELHMCKNSDSVLTGHFIKTQTQSPDILLPYVFKGERTRSKEDFSLRMYSEEVKSWIAEEKKQRRGVITDMQELRHRERPNSIRSSSSQSVEILDFSADSIS
ncbi:hypothetical protein ScPMuIL_006528 [Solemya velum]